MNENEAVTEFGHTIDVFKTRKNGFGNNDIRLSVFKYATDRISHQRHRPLAGACDDKVVTHGDGPLRQAKPLAHVDHRDNAALDVDDTENNVRPIGKWGDVNSTNHPLDEGQA